MAETLVAVVGTLLGAVAGLFGSHKTQETARRIAEMQVREGRLLEAQRLAASAYAVAREATMALHPVWVEDSVREPWNTEINPMYLENVGRLRGAVRDLYQLSVLLAPDDAATAAARVAALLTQLDEYWTDGRTWVVKEGPRATELWEGAHDGIEKARTALLGYTEMVTSRELDHLMEPATGALEELRQALGALSAPGQDGATRRSPLWRRRRGA